jgi:ElaB/YqjD/DUF883 family membrane-anchored ribosome-binding protein
MTPKGRCAEVTVNVTALDSDGRRPIKSRRARPAPLENAWNAARPKELPCLSAPLKTRNDPMSSIDSDRRRGPGDRDADELANQIEAIRADLQNLTSTVGRIAGKQVNRVQDKAIATATEAEEAIRRNPLQAVAIAVGLGFLFGVFTRR